MKRLFGLFVLTASEQRLVVVVMLALVFGTWIKHHRETRLPPTAAPNTQQAPAPFASPSPDER